MLPLRRRGVLPRCLLLAAVVAPSAAGAQSAERIGGVVTTRSGTVHEGLLRFESGASAWVDPMIGRSVADVEWEDRLMEAMGAEVDPRGRSVEFLGVRITWDDDRGPSSAPRTSVSVGDLAGLRATSEGGVEAELRGGEVVVFHNAFGWVDVETESMETVRVAPAEVESIRFGPSPPDALGSARLEGVVEDRWGRIWRGPMIWTRGQSLRSDSLEGRDPDDMVRGFGFDEVRRIEPVFGGGARVATTDGREWELGGTIDFDGSARGVRLVDPVLGVATVPWVDVRRVTLGALDAGSRGGVAPGYDDFDDRNALLGTVRTRDGRTFTGRIHWSDGTRSRWGYLSGESRSVQLDVPLRRIERMERHTSRGARLHLRGGGVVELRAGDFASSRGPILVEGAGGALRAVEWSAVEVVTLETGTDNGRQ